MRWEIATSVQERKKGSALLQPKPILYTVA